jgi:DegV family protein with EDD domain
MINLKEETIVDRIGVASEIFDFVDKNKVLPKTSAVSPEQFREHFEKLLNDYDAVIHVSISSYMSSAYNNAKMASEDMENVYVIDSKNLSTGIALLCIRAREMATAGDSAKEIVDEINSNIVDKVRASFIIEKLNYLHKGGRCSALTLLGANVLKIKPQIVVKDGRMGVNKKYIGGLNKIVSKYIDDLMEEFKDPNLNYVFITHSSEMPECQSVLKEKLKERGFKNIYDTFAGGTISSHCGPNTIGVLFIDK